MRSSSFLSRVRSFCIGLASLACVAQTHAQTYLPTPADWDKLHLQVRWSSFIPIGNSVDQIDAVQYLNGEIFVQTHSGTLSVLDGNTGYRKWSFVPELKERAIFPVGASKKVVFLINGTNLVMIDRASGRLLFTIDLHAIPSTGPVADEEHVFVATMTNKLLAYRYTELFAPQVSLPVELDAIEEKRKELKPLPAESLQTLQNRSPSVVVMRSLHSPFEVPGRDYTPDISVTRSLIPPYKMAKGHRTASVEMVNNFSRLQYLSDVSVKMQPKKLWEKTLEDRVESPLRVLTANETVLYTTKSGLTHLLDASTGYSKFKLKTDGYSTGGIGMGDYNIYLPTNDSYLYSYEIKFNTPNWREPTAGDLSGTPFVTDDSLFVVGGTSGLRRIDRNKGKIVWPTNFGESYTINVHHVLSANPKFVYGTDAKNRLHVIDRNRGADLAQLNLGSLEYHVMNEFDDRLILASKDGRVFCVQDKEIRTPVKVKKDPPLPEAIKSVQVPDMNPMAPMPPAEPMAPAEPKNAAPPKKMEEPPAKN